MRRMKYPKEFEKFERHCDTVQEMIDRARKSDMARNDKDYRSLIEATETLVELVRHLSRMVNRELKA